MEPKTKLVVSKAEAERIRCAVRNVRSIDGVFGVSRPATIRDAPAMLALLKDERVSAAVYTLPRPFSLESITDWIEDHRRQALRGEGLLMVTYEDTGDDTGEYAGPMVSLTDFQFWPEYAACEFGGVIAAHLQNQHMGTKGIKQLCDWVFGQTGVRLLAMTSSLDNIRSEKIFTSMGFKSMDEVDSVRPDGTVRRSLYWEMERDRDSG